MHHSKEERCTVTIDRLKVPRDQKLGSVLSNSINNSVGMQQCRDTNQGRSARIKPDLRKTTHYRYVSQVTQKRTKKTTPHTHFFFGGVTGSTMCFECIRTTTINTI